MPLTPAAKQRIDREVAKYPPEGKQSAILAALAVAQDEYGWLSAEALDEVARYLTLPAILVQEVATFYTMYNVKPVGRFKLNICTNLPCALGGAEHAGHYLKTKLGVDWGETTADGRFTLVESECMGACGDAPVMLVNNKRMCSLMSDARIDALLDELK